MAITLKAQMIIDRDGIFLNVDEFAETADYTPKGGDKIEGIIVIPDFTTQVPEYEIEGENNRKQCEIYISASDVSTPAKGDIVDITSGQVQGEFIVQEIIEVDNTGTAVMAVQKDRTTIGHINRG